MIRVCRYTWLPRKVLRRRVVLTPLSNGESKGKVDADRTGKGESECVNRDPISRGLSFVSIVLVVLGTPAVITLGYLFRNNLQNLYGYWILTTASTFVILAVLSIYGVLREQAKMSGELDLSAMKSDLSYLFRFKHIVHREFSIHLPVLKDIQNPVPYVKRNKDGEKISTDRFFVLQVSLVLLKVVLHYVKCLLHLFTGFPNPVYFLRIKNEV